ncbi:carbohydrate kinase family protein [Virgibacillus oceani]
MITVVGDLVIDILVKKEKTNLGTDTDGNIHFRPGGQANNVASFVRREGVDCQLVGKVGDDPFGNYLIEESKKQGVTPLVTKDGSEKTGSIVLMVDSNDGERSMITDRGANLNLAEADIQGLDNSELVYLSGYSFFSDSTKKAALKVKEEAIASSIPISVDPSSTYFLKENKEAFLDFLEGVTFFFPNYDEGVLLTGEKEPKKIIENLQEYVSVPILTMGNKGCLFYQGDALKELVPPKVDVVDTTAAGDSFAGSFLATYWKTKDVVESAKRAIAVSSHTVTYFGALPE